MKEELTALIISDIRRRKPKTDEDYRQSILDSIRDFEDMKTMNLHFMPKW